jgi:uncharacterized protein (TIGR02996 family)
MSVSTCEDLFQAIRDNPGDFDRRAVFADWLEEAGRAEAAFLQRWMAHHRKYPAHRLRTFQGRAVQKAFSWAWYSEPRSERHDGFRLPHAELPPVVFGCLPKANANVEKHVGYVNRSFGHIFYPSEDDAVNALGVALQSIQETLRVS